MDLLNEVTRKIRELDMCVKSLKTTGHEYAEAERDYKICLRSHALRLRDSGHPVTLIQQIIYGEKEVAEKRFARDVKETMHKANLEYINAVKLQIRILDGQIGREWGQAK